MSEHNNEIIQITNSLSLEQLKVEDADKLFALTEQDREYLSEFLPWPKFTKTVADSEEFIERMLQRRSDDEEYGYGIKDEGNVIGHASLMHLNDDRSPETGYWIASEYAGRGITTKVADALTSFAFSRIGISRLIIRADPRNIGSNKVAEKVGYTLEGQEDEGGQVLNVWSLNK